MIVNDRLSLGWDTESGWCCFGFHVHRPERSNGEPVGPYEVEINFLGFYLNATVGRGLE